VQQNQQDVHLATAQRQVSVRSHQRPLRARSGGSYSTKIPYEDTNWRGSALVLAACSRRPGCPANPGRFIRVLPHPGPGDDRVAAAKDSLVRDLAETTKLLSDINTEIIKVSTKKPVEPVVGAEGMATNERAMVLKRVQDLTSRLKANETRLAASQRRLRQLTGEPDSLKSTLSELQATIDGLQQTLESQKNTIATSRPTHRRQATGDGVVGGEGGADGHGLRDHHTREHGLLRSAPARSSRIAASSSKRAAPAS
jgi:hypothetical protein